MKFLRARIAALIACATLAPGPAHAACGGILNPILVVATPILFGFYSPSADSASNGAVTVSCTVQLGNTLPGFTIALSGGTLNQFSPRQMSFGGNRLGYAIYTSGALDTAWGNGSDSTQTQSYNSGQSLASKNFTAYGVIPKHQFVPTGLYTDSITVTVTY